MAAFNNIISNTINTFDSINNLKNKTAMICQYYYQMLKYITHTIMQTIKNYRTQGRRTRVGDGLMRINPFSETSEPSI